jgi:hypothetical protein
MLSGHSLLLFILLFILLLLLLLALLTELFPRISVCGTFAERGPGAWSCAGLVECNMTLNTWRKDGPRKSLEPFSAAPKKGRKGHIGRRWNVCMYVIEEWEE